MVAILADDIFKCIYLNENELIPIQSSLKFVPRSPIDNKPALVQAMAWHRTDDKPFITWTNADPEHRRIHAALWEIDTNYMPLLIKYQRRLPRMPEV